MSKNAKLSASLAGLLAITAATTAMNASAVPDQPKNWEKCAGIAKQGKNDCGALDGKHSCAGQASKDNEANEWVYVPEGTCEKITGGNVATIKPAKKS